MRQMASSAPTGRSRPLVLIYNGNVNELFPIVNDETYHLQTANEIFDIRRRHESDAREVANHH